MHVRLRWQRCDGQNTPALHELAPLTITQIMAGCGLYTVYTVFINNNIRFFCNVSFIFTFNSFVFYSCFCKRIFRQYLCHVKVKFCNFFLECKAINSGFKAKVGIMQHFSNKLPLWTVAWQFRIHYAWLALFRFHDVASLRGLDLTESTPHISQTPEINYLIEVR